MRNTIDFGIDLGTTNSAIAVLEGTQARVIKNNLNMEYTPSVVWINKNDRVMVGWTAKQRLEIEPHDVKAEFKLQMGTEYVYKFESSGQVKRPEELSAEILKSLKLNVQQRLNEDLTAAVITVPAAFELPQCEATRRAAQLAGIKFSPLIMEPTAAAMAYAFQRKIDKSYWLVYDLGGGTFDAAVIQIRDGEFRIINHAGDNHLGGKLIDWEIVERLLVPSIIKTYKVTDFNRANPKWRSAFAKLKYYAEEAKINLSTQDSYWITIDLLCKDDNDMEIPFEFELKRNDLISLAYPFIKRSINIARQAIIEAGLGFQDIEKVILVGGPTLAPYIREILEDKSSGLGIPLEYSIDPITVVAQGAAIFAGSQRIENNIENSYHALSLNEGNAEPLFLAKLEYDPIGIDPEPLVGGKIIAPNGENLEGYFIEFENPRSQPPWQSGKIRLSTNGTFTATLWAQEGASNIYDIRLTDPFGRLVRIEPQQIEYRIGNKPGDQPLIHSIGVALANNQVAWFFEKGERLPTRQRRVLRSTVSIKAGAINESIRIPVIEGNNNRADRNRLIGTLIIQASCVKRDVPMGTEIEVLIEIDSSRIVKTLAYIPFLDQEFESILDLRKPTLSPDQLRADFEAQCMRLERVQHRALEVGDRHSMDIIQNKITEEKMLENIQTSLNAASGDPDALDKAQNRLLDLKIALDKAEDHLILPSLKIEAEDIIGKTQKIIEEYGDIETHKQLTYLARELKQAIVAEDADLIRFKTQEVMELGFIVLREKPEFWVSLFTHLIGFKNKIQNQRMADQLIEQGRQAIALNDFSKLIDIVGKLITLLPNEIQSTFRDEFGIGSTVQK